MAYAHPEVALFFYAFVIVGSFFAINLFVGVVIDKFSRLRGEFDGSALLTEAQQKWYEAIERVCCDRSSRELVGGGLSGR